MDIQKLETENLYLRTIIERDQISIEVLTQTLYNLTDLLKKQQQDYIELQRKYEELLKTR